MGVLLERAPVFTNTVLDVGSRDINGSYRRLIEVRGWCYTGLDIEDGVNVDVVADPYEYPFEADRFDVVLCGSTMEHVERPWLFVPELTRVLKPGGLLALVTHWQFPVHNHPGDCYRFLPDGMRVLFDDTGKLTEYDIRIVNDTDIIGSALKCDR